jgi:hypothetical protein
MVFGLSNKLLPLRAIAECATYQFLKCEETIQTIKIESPDLLKSLGPLSHLVETLTKSKEERILKQENLLIT